MKLAIATAIAAAGLIAAPAHAQSHAQDAEATASAALEAAPVWDGHNDVPIQLRGRFSNMIGSFDFTDTSDTGGEGRNAMHTDFLRLQQGRVGAQFWSVYVPASLPEAEAVQATLEQIDVTKRLVARYPEQLSLALTADEVAAAVKAGRVASLLGMEGGQSIGSSLAVLRQMYDLGARYMTLTHSKTLSWADSATDDPQHDGLNAFGLDVVREMNRIGMIVDLSHVSEAAMHDALDVARAPVIFSHSGARAISGHPRNVPDGVLSRLRDNGGIVMVVALPAFLRDDVAEWSERRRAEIARLMEQHGGDREAVRPAYDAWVANNPSPEATISDVADHIDQVRAIAGIDHIGIGGDYDGMPSGPVGMEDVAGYPALFVELAKRGYSREDLEKISMRNMMRVMRAVEGAAASSRTDDPIEYPVGEPRG